MSANDFLNDQTMESLAQLIARLKNGQIDLEDIGDELTHLIAHVNQWPQRYPAAFFAILRRVQPILVTPRLTYVTRYHDVCEVLSRDDTYAVVYGRKMTAMTGGGNFFLGMQDSPEYARDTSLMKLAARREDIPERIEPFVTATARDIVDAAGASIDVVQQLTRVVPARWIANYFGVQPINETQFIDDCHDVFQFLFIPSDEGQVEQRATAAAERLRPWIAQAIADRKSQGPGDRDDVLARCLRMQRAGLPGTSDVEIRNNLFGLFVGAVPTTSQATARAINQLLDRPEQLEAAQQAARGENADLLRRHIFEALRFDPINPGLLRLARRDDVLAQGTDRATAIRAGSIVMAATQSAMSDETVIDQPRQFRIDRPANHYLHFGHGLHTCFGRYINEVQIPLIARSILVKNNVRRAPGEAGQLKLRGPFPSSMTLELDG